MLSGRGMPCRACEVPDDAGASPEWATVLAAVEIMDDRASAPDGVRVQPNRAWGKMQLKRKKLTGISRRSDEKS